MTTGYMNAPEGSTSDQVYQLQKSLEKLIKEMGWEGRVIILPSGSKLERPREHSHRQRRRPAVITRPAREIREDLWARLPALACPEITLPTDLVMELHRMLVQVAENPRLERDVLIAMIEAYELV